MSLGERWEMYHAMSAAVTTMSFAIGPGGLPRQIGTTIPPPKAPSSVRMKDTPQNALRGPSVRTCLNGRAVAPSYGVSARMEPRGATRANVRLSVRLRRPARGACAERPNRAQRPIPALAPGATPRRVVREGVLLELPAAAGSAGANGWRGARGRLAAARALTLFAMNRA